MSTDFDPKETGFTRDALLEAIRLGQGRASKRDLAQALKLDADQKAFLKTALRILEDEKAIHREGRKGWALSDTLPEVAVVEIHDRDTDGELLARLTKPGAPAARIRLAPGEGAGGRGGPALGIGDRALVRLARDDEGGWEARLIRKLGQSAHTILCVLRKGKGRPALKPVDRRSKDDLVPMKGEAEKAKDGDLVLCRIARAERRGGPKPAHIIEVIGSADSPGAGSIIALHSHGIPTDFGEEEFRQAQDVKPASQGNREDLRAMPLVTIDPDDAKDHDDAVWAAPDEDPGNKGGWVVIVAIADVAAYVTPGSALDRGALKRGNSVYLPDRVVPMLPERLSNDLCSLRENEDRPCMAVRMVFDKSGHKRGHRFLRGWMRSAAKLSYTQVQTAIDGHPDDKTGPLLEPVLKPLWGAYAAMKTARDQRQPLEIDSPERKVRVGEDGKVIGVETRERFDAHRLIEECMIQANVCAAETLEQAKLSLIYRVHEPPSAEKLQALADFLDTLDMNWAQGETVRTERFNRLLERAKDTPHYATINEVVLRTQSQAVYSPDNQGHFGLNLRRYAHFTSPIRRYADLTVHRALIRAGKFGKDGQTDAEASQLEAIAEDITAAERRAMAAERDAVDRYVALYMSEHVGSEFPGRITGVTRFGAFIRLDETGADGLVPISQLGNERYYHDEAAHALIGERSGDTYRLGMPVKVRILEAAPITGGLLLELTTPPEDGKPPRHGRGRGRPGGHRGRGGPKGRPGGHKGGKKVGKVKKGKRR
ncbi:ribonuclease R [Hyphobacterium sp. SN044]|uniref:ribonuclease R n=1 Tax=Hyphobacterium sp. SN044 TaxID=2912575 RepID=UPI001F00C0FF|nr:ribonuclease R [Hyphobacterium sp. SN044]MCF8878810.1 ribonuclease R [Hyphobacterium sp. SN044]